MLAAFDHKAAAVAYMAALALTSGAGTTVINSAWAEIYGVASLGAIRSLVASLLVLASALSPVLVGRAIDLGTGIEAVALACLGYVAVGTVMLALAARRTQMSPSSDRMTATTTTTPMM